MTIQNEIKAFLNDFKAKLNIWQVIYRDERFKNAQTLLNLDIRPGERTQVLRSLEVQDYSEGPVPERLYGSSDMWVFGKMVKETEIYIKLSLGYPGTSVICISFHESARAMKYPLK